MLFFFSCWLSRNTSLGAFTGIGSIILLADLIVFCMLHASINRLFPEPIEGGRTGSDSESDANSSDEEGQDENCNKDQCNANQCRYKQRQRLKVTMHNPNQLYIPKRKELLHHLHGGLLVLLLLCVTVTFTMMIYSYKGTKSRLLYSLFTYGSAIANFLIALVVLFFFCYKRKDMRKLIKQTVQGLRHRHHHSGLSEQTALVEHNCDREEQTDDHISDNKDGHNHREQPPVGHAGVYGLSDHVVSDGSQFIPSLAPEVVAQSDIQLMESGNEHVKDQEEEEEEEEKEKEGIVAPIAPNLRNATLEACVPGVDQSELSEGVGDERVSNAHNSIGECSLVSSAKQRKKAPSQPVDVPANLKNFVPENWRPARRRMNKGASYYPYYVSDSAPISASLAYSSKSSSLAGTTVSGVPLYKNDVPIMHHPSNGLRPQCINIPGPLMTQQQIFPPNVPIRFAPSPSNFPSAPPMANMGVPMVAMQPLKKQSGDEFGPVPPPVLPPTCKIEEETTIAEQRESTPDELEEPPGEEGVEEEEQPNHIVSPHLYIPMPHVSIKQFIIKNETSV